MKSLTGKEDHRIGDRVHVEFFVDDAVTASYDRYVDAADWDSDPVAVVAKVAQYLNEQAQPEAVTLSADSVVPVTLSSDDIDAKLDALGFSQKPPVEIAPMEPPVEVKP